MGRRKVIVINLRSLAAQVGSIGIESGEGVFLDLSPRTYSKL